MRLLLEERIRIDIETKKFQKPKVGVGKIKSQFGEQQKEEVM
jgi:hypothetical protein